MENRIPPLPCRRRRTGFTLPELLVAAAVSMVIMSIIAVAFQKAIDCFRTLRSVVLMQDKLRSAENVIKRDLAAERFAGPFQENFGKANLNINVGGQFQQGFGGPYVRDQRMDLIGWMPPAQGYFELYSPPSTTEGYDSDGLPSTISPATNTPNQTDWMRFTSRLTGKRPEDWFYAPGNGLGTPGADPNFSSATLIASRWAEISYFLYPNGDSANGVPLYALYRQERLLLPTASAGYPSPSSVSAPNARNGGAMFNVAPSGTGADILITDVLSFEIHANWSSGAQAPLNGPQYMLPLPTHAANHDYPFSNLLTVGQWPYHFDTGSLLMANSLNPPIDWTNPQSFLRNHVGIPANRIRLNTLQIRIRVWDFNTQAARQMCFIQDI